MPLENLRDVRTFLQVVDSGSLSAAARILGTPPNTVSRTIARLEEALGGRLLSRTTRKMSLTDEGKAFYAQAVGLIEAANLAEEALGTDRSGLGGTVRVAVRTTTVQFNLLSDLGELLAAHPSLRIQLVVADAEVDLVAQGMDVALRVGERADSSLRSRNIGNVTFVLAATPHYLERRGRPRSPEDLAAHDLILPVQGRRQSPLVLHGPKNKRVTVMVGGRFECSDVRTQREALLQGMGIAARPLGELTVGASAAQLERVLIPWHLEPLPVYAVFPPLRPSPQRARAVEAVVTTLARAVERMSGERPR